MKLGKLDETCVMLRLVYFGCLKLYGTEHRDTIMAASNYATSLRDLERFEDAKSLIRNMMPVARRVLGDNHESTLRMRVNYAYAPCKDANATLKNLNEAVDTFEEIEPTVRRVFGISHPFTADIERSLQYSRATLRARCISNFGRERFDAS